MTRGSRRVDTPRWLGPAACRISRTPNVAISTLTTPGTSAIRNRLASGMAGQSVSIARLTSGPITAPAVSAARWNPNAIPRPAGAVESAMSASRAAVRIDLPKRSLQRPIRKSGQPST